MGLAMNHKKTRALVISKNGSPPKCMVHVGTNRIEQVGSFNYLGSIITSDGNCRKEIKRRIGVAKDSFQKMRAIVCDRNMKMSLKVRSTTLPYGCETWTLKKQMTDHLEATEMWFLRRMLRISYPDISDKQGGLSTGRRRT